MEQPTEDQPELSQDNLALDTLELGGQEDIEIGEPLPPRDEKSYLTCPKCESFRSEILYLLKEKNELIVRCLGCGNILSFFFKPEDLVKDLNGNTPKKERVRKVKNVFLRRSYLG